MKIIYALTLIVTLSMNANGQTVEQRKEEIKQREAASPSKEALDRKARSIAKLRKEEVPLIEKLPVIEDSGKAKKRSKEVIVQRMLSLYVVALKGEGLEQPIIDGLVNHYGIEKSFSPKELAFIKDPKPKDQDSLNFSWRYESVWIMLWALGFVDTLKRPDSMCEIPKFERSTAKFIEDAKLRPLEEILDEVDIIYRYHWAVTDARLKGNKPPAGLDQGIVLERHYSLNWLIGYMNQEWDDISTDT